jgi:hypothetical protein
MLEVVSPVFTFEDIVCPQVCHTVFTSLNNFRISSKSSLDLYLLVNKFSTYLKNILKSHVFAVEDSTPISNPVFTGEDLTQISHQSLSYCVHQSKHFQDFI